MDPADLLKAGVVVVGFLMGSQQDGLPHCIDDLMAEIAIIAHWPPSEMAAMEINELMGWHQRLVETHNRINRADEQ